MWLATCAQVPGVHLLTSSPDRFFAWIYPRILSPSDVSPPISCLSHRPSDLLLTGTTSIQTQDILSIVNSPRTPWAIRNVTGPPWADILDPL